MSIAPGGTAYIGSMAGGVVRVKIKSARIDRYIAPGAFGSGALYGVLADTRHGLLWTCSDSFAAPATQVAGADAGHWLKAFDLKTGAGRISLALPGDTPVCIVIAVSLDGNC